MSSPFGNQLQQVSSLLGGRHPADPPTTTVEPFIPTNQTEAPNPSQTMSYQSIFFQPSYSNWSPEELQLNDRNQGLGNRTNNQGPADRAFAAAVGTGNNASSATQQRPSLFGTAPTQPTSGPFGNQPASGGLFGTRPSSLFATPPASSLSGTHRTPSTFGSGSNAESQPASGGLFGTQRTPSMFDSVRNAESQPPSGGLFGTQRTRSMFDGVRNAEGQPASGGLYGTQRTPSMLASVRKSTTPKKDDEEWLRDFYSGATAVSVRFGSDDKTYFFPSEVLVKNLNFFRTELKANNAIADTPSDGQSRSVHLPDISSRAFARIIRWTMTADTDRDSAANPEGDYQIDDLLEDLVAADSLELDTFNEFEKYTRCLLATILLKDRRKLTTAHIKLVETLPTFQTKACGVRKVFQDAAMRPLLQSTLLSEARWLAFLDRPQPGHACMEDWLAILRHCGQLMEDNKAYAASVLSFVPRTLATVQLVKGKPGFLDPLADDEMKRVRTLDFDTEFII